MSGMRAHRTRSFLSMPRSCMNMFSASWLGLGLGLGLGFGFGFGFGFGLGLGFGFGREGARLELRAGRLQRGGPQLGPSLSVVAALALATHKAARSFGFKPLEEPSESV